MGRGPRGCNGHGALALPATGDSIHGYLPSSPPRHQTQVRSVLSYRTLLSALSVALLLPAAASDASAQGAALTVEARGGAAIPLSTLADGTGVGEGTSAGPVFGVEITLGSAGWRTLYAGFSQARFNCDDAGCPAGDPYVATGVNVGVRMALARMGGVVPWIGVGGVTTRVESPGVTGSPYGVSELGFGGELAAGLYVRAGETLAFNPAVRYTRVSTEMPGGASLALRYVVADLALVVAW